MYLGLSFAPNHKGMPILTADDDTDFLRRQVLTSRNVRGGPAVDVVFGGLNYQIEHHLFPSMPRPSLRRAQPIVRVFCRQHGLPYAETGLIRSYRQSIGYLHRVGRGDGSGRAVIDGTEPSDRAFDGQDAVTRMAVLSRPGPATPGW